MTDTSQTDFDALQGQLHALYTDVQQELGAVRTALHHCTQARDEARADAAFLRAELDRSESEATQHKSELGQAIGQAMEFQGLLADVVDERDDLRARVAEMELELGERQAVPQPAYEVRCGGAISPGKTMKCSAFTLVDAVEQAERAVADSRRHGGESWVAVVTASGRTMLGWVVRDGAVVSEDPKDLPIR